MSEKMQDAMMGESLKTLGGLRITSLDDDDDNDDLEEQQGGLVDEYDESDDDEEGEPVVLGFVEEAEHCWSLLRQLFPNKAGGTPAWLDPVNLPSGKSSLCDLCGDPLQFVLQVYAPLDDKESTFHRTIFVFMCLSMTCLLRDQHEQWNRHPGRASRSVKVFRCQLPRMNPFYSSVPPKRDGRDKPSEPGAVLCSWCGTWKGDQVCSSCKRGRYCSKKHQAMHWRLGHKVECQQLSDLTMSFDSDAGSGSEQIQKVASKIMWPEYEIINEDESNYEEMSEDNGSATALVSKREDDTLKSLFGSIEGNVDKSWAAFEERIAKAPQQILRYAPRGVNTGPLWPMSSGRPSKSDIPNCSYCGGPRCFEFQILPQLLYYFLVRNEVDSLDWATIAIYTCESSCEANVAYKEEFAWVQLYTPSVRLP